MNKTSISEKLIYSVASMGDCIAYSVIGTFLLFFLTTVAGIEPAPAGTIVVVGTVWNAVFTPVMGYIADDYHQKHGRRGSLILIFAIPLAAALFLLFTNINMGGAIKPFYYGALIIIFWTCYTGFFIPYYALGVDYTSDYEDRTKLRLYASLFNSLGGIFSMVLPTTIIKLLETGGLSTGGAWSVTGGGLGLLTTLSIIITVLGGKKKDIPPFNRKTQSESNNKLPIIDIFKEYWDIARLKPMKYLIITALSALVGQTIIAASLIYYLTYNLELSPTQISGFQLLKTVFAMITIPLVGKLAIKFDKRETLFGLWILGCLLFLAMRFLHLPLIPLIVVYIVATGLCTGTYWQVMPSIFYDVCEYDRIIMKENRSAAIVSFQGFVETLAAGVGSQLLGIILQIAGFNGESAAQCGTALLWLQNSATLLPMAFMIIAMIAIIKYPITRKYYNEILAGKGEE